MAQARLSASLILIRPRADDTYEFLLMKRKKGMSFAQAHVFPGGTLDPSDSIYHWKSLLDITPDSVPQMHNVAEVELNSLKIAAIRETFEESGIFIGNGDLGRPVTGDFKQLCIEKRARPDLSRVFLFTRNIVPLVSKRRFDTVFFIAFVERGTEFVVTEESESGMWISPLEALNLAEVGEIMLEPPQAYITVHLAHHPTLAELRKALPHRLLTYPLPIYGPAKPDRVLVLIYGDEDFPTPPGFPHVIGKRHRISIALPGVDFEISAGLLPFYDCSRWVLRKEKPHFYSLTPKPRL